MSEFFQGDENKPVGPREIYQSLINEGVSSDEIIDFISIALGVTIDHLKSRPRNYGTFLIQLKTLERKAKEIQAKEESERIDLLIGLMADLSQYINLQSINLENIRKSQEHLEKQRQAGESDIDSVRDKLSQEIKADYEADFWEEAEKRTEFNNNNPDLKGRKND